MTTAAPNNPPAYPRPGYYPDDPNDRLEHGERWEYRTDPQDGMSLRDHFAGLALAALLQRWGTGTSEAGDRVEQATRAAYVAADAMLAERRRKGGAG